MDDESGPCGLDSWIDRTRRMIGYKAEARDFVRRAGERMPAIEADAGAVCHLWALADEQDEAICHALTRYDLDLSGPLERWMSPGAQRLDPRREAARPWPTYAAGRFAVPTTGG